MDLPLLALGIAVLLVTALDVLATTLSPATREGPLTRHLGRASWSLAKRAARDPRSPVLILAGPLILAVAVLTWMGLMLLGWWLVFLASPTGVAHTTTAVPADALERLYFTGYTLFTLGNGEFVPEGGWWQLATVVATANGLLMATLSITYMLPVVTAVTQRRQVAAMVSGLGTDVPSILRTSTMGSPALFEQFLLDISGQVVLTAERHLAYPLIHYFRSTDRETAFAPTIAALDEVVGVLLADAERSWAPDPVALLSYRRAVERLLEAAHCPPPVPDEEPALPRLPEDVRDVIGHPDEVADPDHRRRLAAFVADAGWRWEHVIGSDREHAGSPRVGQPA